MTIQKGDAPADGSVLGVNKFLGAKKEGHRGLLLGRSPDKKEGVMLALTLSLDPADGIVPGRLYAVRELVESQYPYVVGPTDRVPAGFELPTGAVAASVPVPLTVPRSFLVTCLRCRCVSEVDALPEGVKPGEEFPRLCPTRGCSSPDPKKDIFVTVPEPTLHRTTRIGRTPP